MLQPKRFMAAVAPTMAISVPTSRMPVSMAITTIITLEENVYSIQRAGFCLRASRRSYQRRAGKATMKCAIELMAKNEATATPIGNSNSVRVAGSRVRGAGSKARELEVIDQLAIGA